MDLNGRWLFELCLSCRGACICIACSKKKRDLQFIDEGRITQPVVGQENGHENDYEDDDSGISNHSDSPTTAAASTSPGIQPNPQTFVPAPWSNNWNPFCPGQVMNPFSAAAAAAMLQQREQIQRQQQMLYDQEWGKFIEDLALKIYRFLFRLLCFQCTLVCLFVCV